ncbi:unnamed protein product [Closterium sp. NIES-54]
MADRKEGHAGGLDCGSRARRSDEGSSSDSSSSYGSSHGSLTVANDTSITATAAVVAAAAAAESTATEFAVTAITSAADSETEALLSFGASSSDPSTPRDDFSSTPSESPSPSPPSPQFAVSDAAQPWSRTGGAMALDAARLIQQVGMQQLMRRRQSPRRASAPEQLPDPQPSTWAYSRPVVILDAFWNLAFVVVTAITLFISQARNERPPAPLSIWLLGYAVQCAVHVICVLLEHERRESRRVREQREQRRGGRRARRRGRAGRRARDGRIDRGRERGGELERGSGGATGGNGSVNGETGGGGGAEGTEFDVPLNQSGELGGIRGSGDWGGNAEGTGSRREGEGEEEFISILRRRDAGRAVTLDEAASVLITGRDLVVDREEREGEALEGLLGAERAGGEDGRGDAQARRVGRMVGEEGATVADEEMMVGAVDEESANTMFSFAWWLELTSSHALSCLLSCLPLSFSPSHPFPASHGASGQPTPCSPSPAGSSSLNCSRARTSHTVIPPPPLIFPASHGASSQPTPCSPSPGGSSASPGSSPPSTTPSKMLPSSPGEFFNFLSWQYLPCNALQPVHPPILRLVPPGSSPPSTTPSKMLPSSPGHGHVLLPASTTLLISSLSLSLTPVHPYPPLSTSLDPPIPSDFTTSGPLPPSWRLIRRPGECRKQLAIAVRVAGMVDEWAWGEHSVAMAWPCAAACPASSLSSMQSQTRRVRQAAQ